VFAVVRRRLYQSVDGGASWRWVATGLGACRHWLNAIALSPEYATDRTLFLSCRKGGLYRSLDGGRSWQGKWATDQDVVKMVPSPRFATDRTVLALTEEGALLRISSDQGGMTWSRVDVDVEVTALEWTDGVVFAGTRSGSVYTSTDGGARWRRHQTLSLGAPITAIAVPRSFESEQVLLVGTSTRGLFRLVWRTAPSRISALGTSHITALAILYEHDRLHLLATTRDRAVYRSEDGGDTWSQHATGLLKNGQADLYGTPHFTSLHAAGGGAVFAAGFCGVFRSADGGRSWDWGPASLEQIVGLDVAASAGGDPAIAIATYGFGVYSSEGGGAGFRAHNVGVPNTRVGPIAFSPDFARDRTMFATSFDNVLRSTDAGASWSLASLRPSVVDMISARISNLLSRGRSNGRDQYLVPDRGELDLIPLVVAVSPSFAADQTLFVGMFPNGLQRSRDGGRSFEFIWGADGKAVTAVALSPGFATDRTLFAGLLAGIFRSTDAGDSWTAIGDGLDLRPPHGDLYLAGIALAISPDFERDQTLYAGTSSGLYRTPDRGQSWTRLALPEPDADLAVTGLAISPAFADDRTVLVQTEGGGLYVGRDDNGRFVASPSTTVADGLEFTQLIKRESAPLVVFSPDYKNDHAIYGASNRTLARSTDGGMTWHEVSSGARRYDVDLRYGRLDPILPTVFRGSWRVEAGDRYSNGQVVHSSTASSEVSLKFAGAGVSWIASTGPDRGTAGVYVDGALRGEVDLYRAANEDLVEVFAVSGLDPGPHTVTVRVSAVKNDRSTGTRVDVDAFDVSLSEGRP